jgi:hypothetical protein
MIKIVTYNDQLSIEYEDNSYRYALLSAQFNNQEECEQYKKRAEILNDKKVFETSAAFFVQFEVSKYIISESDVNFIGELEKACNLILENHIKNQITTSELIDNIKAQLNTPRLKSIIASSDSQWMLIRLIENMMTALGELIKDSFSLANNPFRFYKTASEETCDAFRDSVISLDENADASLFSNKDTNKRTKHVTFDLKCFNKTNRSETTQSLGII